MLLFLEAGFKYIEILEMDYWQFLGYLKALKEKARRDAITQSYQRSGVHLLFCLAKSWGLEEESDKFFSFEGKINEQFGYKPKEDTVVSGKGRWETIDGKRVFVYNQSYIDSVARKIDKFGR